MTNVKKLVTLCSFSVIIKKHADLQLKRNEEMSNVAVGYVGRRVVFVYVCVL